MNWIDYKTRPTCFGDNKNAPFTRSARRLSFLSRREMRRSNNANFDHAAFDKLKRSQDQRQRREGFFGRLWNRIRKVIG